jgi:uncharacterized membrane protein
MRRHLSIVGLLLGAMFFAFSLTPSLLPGSFLIHGALSGKGRPLPLSVMACL